MVWAGLGGRPATRVDVAAGGGAGGAATVAASRGGGLDAADVVGLAPPVGAGPGEPGRGAWPACILEGSAAPSAAAGPGAGAGASGSAGVSAVLAAGGGAGRPVGVGEVVAWG